MYSTSPLSPSSASIVIISCILIIFVICILVYIIILSQTKLTSLTYQETEIPRFSTDITFDPYPTIVDIENQIDCNAKSLHVCKMDDPTTLFGCRELIVKCHHFDKDTSYIEKRETTIIPKNSNPNEGYALAITSIAESCNVYHGDLILVTVNPDSSEYSMVCDCKNPGYIGNENLMGNCTTVYICDGRIDNINQPLANISCVCDRGYKSMRYDDGLPVCREMTVLEANQAYKDWTSLVKFNSDRQLDIINFNPTVRGNLKIKKLLNPCTNSLHDTTIEITTGHFDEVHNECHVVDSGYPVVNGLLDFKGGDKYDTASIGGVLATGPYLRIRFTDQINNKSRIYGLVVDGIKFHKDYSNMKIALVPSYGLSLGSKGALMINSRPDFFIAPKCDGSWPTYSCSMDNYYTYKDSGLPYPGARDCPTMFLWDRTLWENCEFLIRQSIKKQGRGISINNSAFKILPQLRAYGVQYDDL